MGEGCRSKYSKTLTRTSDIAVLSWGAGVAAPILVVDLEEAIVFGAILVHSTNFACIATALILNKTYP